MSEKPCYKFLLMAGAGDCHDSVDDMFYNWSVIHTSLFLGTSAALNFARYAQNYLNPDVPNELRLVDKHPSFRYHIMGDHTCMGWDKVRGSLEDPSHAQRMGRHHFGDPKTLRMFFGVTDIKYRAPGFSHAAGLMAVHYLALPDGQSRDDFLPKFAAHQTKMVECMKEFGKPSKYTVSVFDEDTEKKLKEAVFSKAPAYDYVGVEFLHFKDKHDAYSFMEKYRDPLRSSYADFINTGISHSLVGVEKVILDYTDENPKKMRLPMFFTDKESLEYHIMHDDWYRFKETFGLLADTKWSHHQTLTDREKGEAQKVLHFDDPKADESLS